MSFIYACKKADRLASALYILSSFISYDDPLQGRMRMCAIALMDGVHALTGAHHDSLSAVATIQKTIREAVSILLLAYAAGYLSKMNHDVVREELENFFYFVGEKGEGLVSQDVLLPSDFFMVEGRETLPVSSSAVRYAKAFRDRIGHSEQEKKKEKSHIRSENTNEKKVLKTYRQEKILEAIKQIGKASVRDIVKVVPDVSEKTVQRDLLALVSRGVLKKSGSRRWSMYFVSE